VYTADQTIEPAAKIPRATDNTARASNEHPFQLGNNRMTLIGSNFGTFRIRQDEGGAKWLQDSNAADKKGNQQGGGFGYLLDSKTGKMIDSTYYISDQRRSFGIGYAETTFGQAASSDVSGVNTVAVPFGDDPVVLIEVNLTNHRAEVANVDFVEVWGSRMVHMAPKTMMPERRKFSDNNYKSTFSTSSEPSQSPSCIVHKRQYTGSAGNGTKAVLEDVNPPWVFVCLLSHVAASSFGNDAASFFGRGGVRNPAARVTMSDAVGEADTALLTRSTLSLAGGGSGAASTASLCYVVGYTYSTAASPAALAQKYESYFAGGLRERVTSDWKPHLTRVQVPQSPSLSAELLWHSYYLQGGISYDTFFGEHMLVRLLSLK
jgi:hypothetical protein